MFKSRPRPSSHPFPRRGRLNALAWPLPLLVATTALTHCGSPTPPGGGSGGQSTGGRASGGQAGGGAAGAGGQLGSGGAPSGGGHPGTGGGQSGGGAPGTGGAAGSDGAAVIGPAGGAVTQAGGRVTVSLSAGAVAQPIAVHAVPTSAPHAIPGSAFDLSPEGTLFATPASLTIVYDPAALPPGTDEARLRLVTLTADGLELAMSNAVVDTDRHAVTGRIPHFSVWYLTPSPSSGDFSVTVANNTDVGIVDTTPSGVWRVFVPLCPLGAPACAPQDASRGCTDADFSPDPTQHQRGATLACLTTDDPATCPPPGDGAASDLLTEIGFYCYRAGSETIELFKSDASPMPAPPPVALSTSENAGDDSVVLTWRPIPSATFPAEWYWIGDEAGPWGTVKFRAGVLDAYIVPGPSGAPDQMEVFALWAEDATGAFAAPALATVIRRQPIPGVPPPPSMIVSQATTTSITLSWSAVPTATVGYTVWRVGGPILGTSDLTVTDTGLTPGTTYAYIVHSLNFDGSGPDVLLHFATRPLP